MKKRIYRYMITLTLMCLVAYAVGSTAFFYNITRDTVIRDVREKAELLTAVAGTELADISRVPQFDTNSADIRVTVIARDGKVLFDNFADAGSMGNHSDREEFLEAARIGIGESSRYSHTQGTLTYYYAVRLPDQSVLRLSKTIASVRGVLVRALPILALLLTLVFVLGNVLADRLTKSILKPIHAMDPEQEDVVYDELSPLVRTIAHQKENIAQQQQDLNRRAELTYAIVHNMREGLVLLDGNGNVLMVNASARRILGAGKDVVGDNVLALTRNMELLEHAKAALTAESRDCRITFGAQIFQVFFSPAPERGAMLIFVDVTEKDKAEKTRAEFSANVSHELKTPLTSIYGYAEMLHKGLVAPEDIQRFAGVIEAEAFRLIGLVEDIMKLSRLDEDTQNPNMEPVDLAAIGQEVLQSLRHKAEAQRITLSVQGEAPQVLANPAMIREMILNLLDNAIKYNRLAGSVRVDLGAKDGKSFIEVADTGIGISQEDQQRIFERFYRADKSRSKKVDGTGLGLAIVKHIVILHEGSIDVASNEGQGTKVTIFLPQSTPESLQRRHSI